MKATLWTIILLAAIIAALGIASVSISSKISQDYSREAMSIEEDIRKEDWAQAKQGLSSMLEKWEDTCTWLQFWVNHEDTDNVTLALERALAAVEVKDLSTYFQAEAELKEFLRHIYHRDALTIGNIL